MHWANRDAVRHSDVDDGGGGSGQPNDWGCGDVASGDKEVAMSSDDDEVPGDVVAMMSDDDEVSGDVVAMMSDDEVPGDEAAVMPDCDDDDDETSRDFLA